MLASTRKPELALILSFLAIICAVPLTQIGLELHRGGRVQATDVFRYRPTAKNLRQYERTLEAQSWFQQTLRPEVQEALFKLLGDTGAKAILGRNQWLFYRPDVRYLVEPDRPETDDGDSKWAQSPDGLTQRQSVGQAIVRFHRQLQERGIQLLVLPIPGKPSIYPDQLTARAIGHAQDLRSPTLALLAELRQHGVESVNLFDLFAEWRARHAGPSLYLAQDTHWTPVGANLAANAVARRLQELHWTPAATHTFLTNRVEVQRHGDLLEMIQIPGLQQQYPPEAVSCEQVRDPALGLLVPAKSERPGVYKYPGQNSTLLLLGDSFCRIYQFPEPASLGQVPAPPAADTKPEELGAKRLLPGSAGFISHLALALQAPVDAIVSDGGASSDVRQRLSTNPEILEGKKVVVWEFVERDIRLGRAGWEEIPLPPKLGQ